MDPSSLLVQKAIKQGNNSQRLTKTNTHEFFFLIKRKERLTVALQIQCTVCHTVIKAWIAARHSIKQYVMLFI